MAYKDKEQKKAYNAAYRAVNKEQIKVKGAAYRAVNKEQAKAYRTANKEKINAQKADWYAINKERLKVINAAYRAANKEQKKAINADYKAKNKEQINARMAVYIKSRKKTDFVFAMKQRISGLIRDSLRNKNYAKTSRTHEILGCDYEAFTVHLESQFVDGMNWDNRDLWHIDHIIPIASAQTEEDVLRLNHYTNLRPLWAEENRSKSKTMPPVHIQQRVKRDYAKTKGVRIPLKQQTLFDLNHDFTQC